MKVLKARYLLKFKDGRQENPDDLFRRVAKAIANSDKEYDDFKHEETEKIGAEPWSVPGGTPGLDTIAAAVLDLAIQGKITFSRIAESLAATPSRICGIDHLKGEIRRGLDGDLVLVDIEVERRVAANMIHSKAKRSVFE